MYLFDDGLFLEGRQSEDPLAQVIKKISLRLDQ